MWMTPSEYARRVPVFVSGEVFIRNPSSTRSTACAISTSPLSEGSSALDTYGRRSRRRREPARGWRANGGCGRRESAQERGPEQEKTTGLRHYGRGKDDVRGGCRLAARGGRHFRFHRDARAPRGSYSCPGSAGGNPAAPQCSGGGLLPPRTSGTGSRP